MKAFPFVQFLLSIGFFLYLDINSQWVAQIGTAETYLFMRRATLLFILLPLFGYAAATRRLLNRYWRKPKWRETIHFPFFWSGFYRTSVKVFLIIALAVNGAVFSPFIIWNEEPLTRKIGCLPSHFPERMRCLKSWFGGGAAFRNS